MHIRAAEYQIYDVLRHVYSSLLFYVRLTFDIRHRPRPKKFIIGVDDAQEQTHTVAHTSSAETCKNWNIITQFKFKSGFCVRVMYMQWHAFPSTLFCKHNMICLHSTLRVEEKKNENSSRQNIWRICSSRKGWLVSNVVKQETPFNFIESTRRKLYAHPTSHPPIMCKCARSLKRHGCVYSLRRCSQNDDGTWNF